MNHSSECIKKQNECHSAVLLWRFAYPFHCVSCNGARVKTWRENQSPLGSGLYWPEELSEPCSACLENGVCPRCGATVPENFCEDELACKVCGWNWGKNPNDVCPDEYECWGACIRKTEEELDF